MIWLLDQFPHNIAQYLPALENIGSFCGTEHLGAWPALAFGRQKAGDLDVAIQGFRGMVMGLAVQKRRAGEHAFQFRNGSAQGIAMASGKALHDPHCCGFGMAGCIGPRSINADCHGWGVLLQLSQTLIQAGQDFVKLRKGLFSHWRFSRHSDTILAPAACRLPMLPLPHELGVNEELVNSTRRCMEDL
ncbi:hypothetical protein CHU93_13635 [Sandarakinorhabdus cyanobacteriorum]|uniref:Uncharacterized protein n=1 Tax=Sandarakinorhabdus cyanobacteriorum TaxID=1981098 RepID=A0A255Y970_9SPHN|nr:hypothetical protein CHU93_13635 [Sandarakinorhabdus cyanobacteriorum]